MSRSRPTRGPKQVGTFKEVSRVLAGFHDGLADEGVGAGPGSLVGLKIAHGAGLDRPRGRLRGIRSGAGPRARRQHRGHPEHDEAKADKATT